MAWNWIYHDNNSHNFFSYCPYFYLFLVSEIKTNKKNIYKALLMNFHFLKQSLYKNIYIGYIDLFITLLLMKGLITIYGFYK